MFAKAFAILSIASLALALPQNTGDNTGKAIAGGILPQDTVQALPQSDSSSGATSGTNNCANGMTQSCCAGGATGGLVPGLNCITVGLLIGVPVAHNCGDLVSACCNNDKINAGIAASVHCNPLKVAN